MSFDQVFGVVNRIPSPWNILLWWLLGIGTAAYLASKTFKFVPQCHKALRTRWKKVIFKNGEPVELGPGLHIMWPWMNGLVLVSTLDRPLGLLPIRLQISEYVVVDVSSTVTFSIHNIYKVLYGADNFETRLIAGCEAELRRALTGVSSAKFETEEQDRVTQVFYEIISPLADELGVQLKALDITNVAPDAQFAIAGAIESHGTPAKSISS
jgi:regulator of protease activity HflC (stomatin/prohibitin superfamily)